MTERKMNLRNAAYAAAGGGAAFGVIFGSIIGLAQGWLPPATSEHWFLLGRIMLETGIFFGVGFGLFVGLFLRFGPVPRVDDLELAPGEVIRHVGGANHFENLEGRGGTLVLTNQALVFMPHIVNFQRNEARIPLSDIVEFDAVRTLGIIPNGLSVTSKFGNQERFAVNHRRRWLELLRNI